MRPSRVELIIEIGDKSYKVNSINSNDEKKELFYHFSHPKNLKKKILNYNLNKYAGVPEHISFHADGRVHLKLKNEPDEINPEMMPDNIFLPINKEIVTPLLIHSVYPFQGKYVLSEFSEINEAKVHSFKFLMEKPEPFSIILFLCHGKVNFNDFLNDKWIKFFSQDQYIGKISVSRLGDLSGEIPAYDEWVIKYIVTDLTLPIKMGFESYHCAFAYSDLNVALKDLLHKRLWQPQVMIGNRINR